MTGIRVLPALVWLSLFVAVTAVMIAFRSSLNEAHVALLLLLVILGGSAAAGRVVGVLLAVLSFLAFNWFFLPPYYTWAVANPLDWIVLAAFLVTGLVAAQLLYAAREEARLARQRAAELDRLASLSHDLRTPLTTIKALAHDLSVLGDERTEIIEQEADRLSRSVADLLDLSRLNAGAMPVRPELNAVDDLLGALAQRVEPVVGPARLHVSLPPDDPLLVGTFDFVHTLRIVSNLVENAAKYSSVDAPIDVSAFRDGDKLVLDVSDRGAGVPSEEVERVFDAFYRPTGTPPDATGAGLGLSIARRLAIAQEGTLSYLPREGGGSTFRLSLPAADLPG